MSVPAPRFLPDGIALLERIAATQGEAIETAAQWCADAIGSDGLVHLFGTGHSRIPVEEMFPRYGDRKSTRLNSSHIPLFRMPSSA